MEYLVISDLHLTEYNEKKFQYLKNLFEKYENIIINGDLWTSYYKDFNFFFNSKWNQLFPILKSKNSTYVEGNHDPFAATDERVSQICKEHKKEMVLVLGNEKYIIRHGHTYFKKTPPYVKFVWKKLHLYNLRMVVEQFVADHFGRDLYEVFYSKDNTKIKTVKALSEEKDTWLLTGHTHVAEYNFKEKFVNTGFTNFGLATYAVLTELGPKLYHEKY